jgi:hypothetical protein
VTVIGYEDDRALAVGVRKTMVYAIDVVDERLPPGAIGERLRDWRSLTSFDRDAVLKAEVCHVGGQHERWQQGGQQRYPAGGCNADESTSGETVSDVTTRR